MSSWSSATGDLTSSMDVLPWNKDPTPSSRSDVPPKLVGMILYASVGEVVSTIVDSGGK